MNSATTIHLIGAHGNAITPENARLIERCPLLIASDRMIPGVRAYLPDYPNSSIEPIAPLQKALKAIGDGLLQGDVAVIASGDPLFFGIGPFLRSHFGTERLQIHPAVSAMQLAFARISEPWHDATFVSLHGRKWDQIDERILFSEKICILTDQENTPAIIARKILTVLPTSQIRRYRCFVGENLGCSGEKMTAGSLAEIAERECAPLNLMIILKEPELSSKDPVFGIQESALQHSRGLITKDEIRAAIIHSLAIPQQGVFWDIGAGSGSVSIEIARLASNLSVYSIERHDEQILHITSNRERFSAWNVQVFKGEAPEILENLPAPDRVFIGGSGRKLQGIIDCTVPRLKTGGRIVVSAVLAKTCEDAPRFLHAQGLAVEIRRIEVSRSVYPSQESMRLNPISIIIGQKSVE